MKKSILLSALILTSAGYGFDILPSNAGILSYSIENIETTDTKPALYGLTLNLPADTLYVGETRQILANWDGDCYLTEPLVIQSENNDIATVYRDGHIFANKPGTASLYIKAKLDPEKVNLAPNDDGIRTVTATVTVVDAPNLTDEQQAALERTESKEEGSACQFPRTKAEIKRLPSTDAPRLTLDTVNQMIAESDSFETLFRKITDAQPYPDYYGGSGFTSVLYCLNDNGTERIRVMLDCGQPPHQIIYERLDQNGIAEESCYLYPESQVNEVIFTDPNPVLKDWFYSTMNDIPRGILEGDVTNDGKVNVADAIYLQKWLLCEQDTQEINGETADMNQDGKLNAIDLTLIKRTLL